MDCGPFSNTRKQMTRLMTARLQEVKERPIKLFERAYHLLRPRTSLGAGLVAMDTVEEILKTGRVCAGRQVSVLEVSVMTSRLAPAIIQYVKRVQ